ncbi:MAG TPA: transcription termination factor Rho [Acidimicrobiia bacterium]|nr:transcription termination factor Rho [Acidimicrobiia bacterium]
MTETFDRSQLDGKDREQLSTIASALGVKSISRLKKAELIDAIVGAAGGANGASDAKPRRIRSTKPAADDLDALAAEQDALAAGPASNGDDMALIRPRRGSGGSTATTATATTTADSTSGGASNGEAAGASSTAPTSASTADAPTRTDRPERTDRGDRHNERNDRNNDRDGGQWQDGDGNKRRRRRRGRERDRERTDREPRVDEGGGGGGGSGEPIPIEGLLDLRDEGYGFLRTTGYLAGRNDAYVSASQVRRFSLRKGDYLQGATRPPASNEKYPALMRVDTINGMTPDEARTRARFEDLTPLFPDERLRLELADEPLEMTGRIIDLVAPIGKGQRGMIVSPPKAGKTTIMKQIVYSVERNNPETHVMVLLVDERPEEVTDMRRHVLRAEVVASTFDRPSDEHCHVAELTIERAKRLVELGKDVVIILDGITRLARAYNLAAPASGRIMSGGIDAGALYPPKKFFGAARNVEEGGSLTIIATALVETNSKMDEHIFEEFKGTGNMELRLDRRLADRRVYPAIDVEQSGTRHEELLFDRSALQQVWKLRRVLNALESGSGLELLIDKIRTTKSNDEFLSEIAKAPSGMA